MDELKRWLLLGFLSFVLSSNAQVFEGHFMPFGLGYTFQTVKDQSLSPVSYSGHLGSLHSGYYYQNKNWISRFDLNGFGAFIYPNVNRENNTNSALAISSRAIYSLSYKVVNLNSWHVFAGLSSHNSWDYRDVSNFSNSSFNFNGFFSAGPIITTQKSFFLWKQAFGFQYSITLPVATYAFRPGYIKPFLAEEIASKEFYFLGDYYSLDSKVELLWKLASNNQLRLSYQWEFSELDALNKIQIASHFITISTLYRF